MTHEENIQLIFSYTCKVLRVKGLSFRSMDGRKGSVRDVKNYTLGYTNLKTGVITIDIYTPKFRKPKSINGILRVLAHEIAHHQKPPYFQRYRGKQIIRQHYPRFYKQVNKNIEKFKKDKILGQYFIK